MTQSKNSNSTHHHGNLKQALVLAGLELLHEGGLSNLTLRKCAAKAGVSHAAPAHHFKGLKGLTTAIVTHGHLIFVEFMQQGVDAANDDPKSKLMGCCNGYIKFNETHPALGSMLFFNENCFMDDAEWQAVSNASYKMLIDVAAPFEVGEKGAVLNEIAIWTMLEGYCNFMRWGKLNNIQNASQSLEFDDLLNMLNLRVKL